MVDLSALNLLPRELLETLPEVSEDLFPLPLTAFEKYVLWDETESLPMSYFIELRFLDAFNVEVMEQSLTAASRIHPMIACRLSGQDSDLNWVLHRDFQVKIIRELESPPLQSNGREIPFDLRNESGARFSYRPLERGGCRLLLQVHHATTDAVGMRRLMIDALTMYAHATTPDKVDRSLRYPWSKIEPGLLKQRADLSDAFGGPPSQPLTTWQRLKNARYFHFQLPTPIRGSLIRLTSKTKRSDAVFEAEAGEVVSTDVDRFEPLEHLIIDRETSTQILEKTRKVGHGVSDVALALLFETCSLWNQQHGDRNPRSRLRVLLPYDLRSRIDLKMPATNRLSFAFLGRTQNDCQDLGKLIPSLREEVESFSKTHLPMDFYGAIQGASKHPRLMRWAIRRSRNMATSVLTYVGDTSRGMQRYFPEVDGVRLIGDTRLDAILGAPPVRDNTNWSVGLCVNWGQLCISAAWNRDALTRKQCAELLSLYHSRWLNWLNG